MIYIKAHFTIISYSDLLGEIYIKFTNITKHSEITKNEFPGQES